jgi:hypothetical protein
MTAPGAARCTGAAASRRSGCEAGGNACRLGNRDHKSHDNKKSGGGHGQTSGAKDARRPGG